jgi:pilus assembly protein FimV
MTAARFALTSLTAAALTVLSGHAMALGLGRLSVLSALGEPLRAEIDVTSLSAEEASTLQSRVASPDAYRAAGVDYNAVLTGAQVSLARRADGRPYMRVVSDRVVTEPFVDVILEMTWASGRLVREYTLLLDPPKTAAEPAAPTAAPVFAQPARTAPSAAPTPRATAPAVTTADAAAAPASAPRRAVRPAAQPKTAAAAPAAAAPAGEGVKVRQGDTLSAIAARNQPAGVSLDQMLVSLFRGNPQAFVGNNMNRLRAGAVLTVPSADEAKAIPAGEARETIVAQSADFDAYRRKLASGVQSAGDTPSRQAAGKVQAAVEDRKQAAAPTPDKLKLSQGAVQSGAAAEATISREAAAKEASTRVAELSRNVEELRKLQGTSAPAPAASVPAVAAAPAPAAPPAASAPALPGGPRACHRAAPPPAPVASAAVAAAPASAASAPAVAAKAAPPIAQPEEPGFVDSILSSPFMLPGAGILLLVLGAFGIYRVRAGGRKAAGETSFLESRLQPDSFFGASGGQRVDTHDGGGTSVSGNSQSSSMSYSLSQLDAIGDVDPVAEADVYLAYGRDLQAEEILKEAMRATPDRLAIRTKLLEVYAKRRDTKGFELLATQLYALTHGVGEEWNSAQEMGRSIDPENALYQPGGEPDALLQDGDHYVEPLGASTLPQSVMPSPSTFATAPGSLQSELPADSRVDLDLDLGFDSAAPAIEPPAPSLPEQTQPFAPEPQAPLQAPEFDGLAPELPDFGAEDRPSTPYETTSVSGQGAPSPAPLPVDALDFDLADISLDLDAPAPAPTSAQSAAAADGPKTDSSYVDFDLPEGPDSRFNEEGDPLERKMELADEFRQIGDMEGARDLLEEVVAQADGALKHKAQNMLDSLG